MDCPSTRTLLSFCISISLPQVLSAVKCLEFEFKSTFKGNNSFSYLFKYRANRWKQILKYGINGKEVKMEDEKMDLSLGREQQGVLVTDIK